MHSGLGRHTKAVGGPVGPDKVLLHYKVSIPICPLMIELTEVLPKLFLPVLLFYFTSAVAIKTSLILLYYRIFGIHRWFRFELIAAWIIAMLYYIVDFFVGIFECEPVAYFWDKTIKGGTCINQSQFFRWSGVANLLIDFMILTLTIPLIWRLNLKVRQKASLSAIFLLGTLYVILHPLSHLETR